MALARLIAGGRAKDADLSGFVAVDAAAPVREVVRQMRGENCATALVMSGDLLAGIFTERDLLHKVATYPERLDTPVRDLMTPGPDTIRPETDLLEALRRMNSRRYRNLPVLDGDGRLLGNLTDDAILWFLVDRLQAEVINLPPDPDQVPKSPEGA